MLDEAQRGVWDELAATKRVARFRNCAILDNGITALMSGFRAGSDGLQWACSSGRGESRTLFLTRKAICLNRKRHCFAQARVNICALIARRENGSNRSSAS